MILSIIIIGDEILLGSVTDTNSGAIARAFTAAGWQIGSIVTVGDDAAEIRAAVRAALGGSDAVITTGGLGPTKDDITKKVLTEIFGGSLVLNSEVSENIRRVFAARGLTLNSLTENQALVPSTCHVIQNRFGTAPIMIFEADSKVLAAMPGVPFETEGMLPEVLAALTDSFHKSHPSQADIRLLHASLMVTGITESSLSLRLEKFENSLSDGLHLAYLPSPGLIHLRLDGKGLADSNLEQRHAAALSRLKAELGNLLIHDGYAEPAQILLECLREKHLTFASAESCTGGNIARAVTSIPGCSDVYVGSVVSYANEVKHKILHVPTEALASVGAVSREVVEAMAAGVCAVTGADTAVATSGIAGPSGGTPDKPVGSVWIAWSIAGKVSSRLFRFPGDRARVINRATTEALLTLAQKIKHDE